jgi:probable blue pigment (indigoidine) exporter
MIKSQRRQAVCMIGCICDLLRASSLSVCQNENEAPSIFGSKPVMTVVHHAGRTRISPLGLIFLAIASVGWGLNFPIMKHLLTEWPPLSSRGLCGIAGAAALALIALARHQTLRVPRPMWLRLGLVSTLTIGGWVAFMGLALLWLSASEAAVLGISIPVWVAFLAWPILGERVSPVRAVSLAVALAGITVLIGGNGIDASIEKLPGLLCAMVGAVCVGLGTVLTKHFPLAMPPLSLAAWQVGLGCVPIAIVGLAAEHPQLAALSSVGWASLAYMTLIQFCLCYVCWFAALERLPAATASIGTLLVPVIGVLAAAAMLHEPLGLREITALAFALGGVVMALRS